MTNRYFDWPSSLKRFVRFDAARAEDVNDALDELTAGVDILNDDVNRSIKLPVGTADQMVSLLPGQRANLILRFDADGNISAMAGGGRWRGDWATATLYVVGDYVRDAVSKNIYSTVTQHTSGVLATDIAGGLMQLAINVVDVELAKADAQAARDRASQWANQTGAVVADAEFSAKEYATGTVVPTGSAKSWADFADQRANFADAAALSAAGSASYVGVWSTLTGSRNIPATVFHVGKFWALLRNVPNIALSEPGVSIDWAKSGGGLDVFAYDNRALLRAVTATAGDQAIVEGLGLFVFAAASTEPDDDESCFATASGRWLLEAAHWDLVDSWQAPDDQVIEDFQADEPLRFASRVLAGSATCAITSVATVSSASFTGTVTGAATGDRVIATPPGQLGDTATSTAQLSYHAWVSAANTVTVMLTNASASAANTNPAIRAAWPLTVIKP